MKKEEVHLKLSKVVIDNENLDYIKLTSEICGKLRDDLVKLFADDYTCSTCKKCILDDNRIVQWHFCENTEDKIEDIEQHYCDNYEEE